MKATITQPVERDVTVVMKESEARCVLDALARLQGGNSYIPLDSSKALNEFRITMLVLFGG